MLLLFDVAGDAVDEHDDWHTHEHMPERLALPGFLRGTRWTRAGASPRYCVVYEVADPAVLDSAAYRARLEQPTPWTARMMTRYLGMRRTLCAVAAAAGEGVGVASLVVTLMPAPEGWTVLRRHLSGTVVPGLAGRRGIASCRLLESALPAPMTREQAIRGRDAAVAAALWVTGYDVDAVAALAAGELAPARLAEVGAVASECALFTLAFALAGGATAPVDAARHAAAGAGDRTAEKDPP
jgi:hypothetical protein